MTDRHAAEAVGLNPDAAAYTKSKPRVRAYMLEHRAAVQQQLVQQEADLSRRAVEGLHRLNLEREQVLARLWEIANLSPEMTRNSITGQVKALSMIVAMQKFIPDRLAASSEKKSAPAPIHPPINAADWLCGQQTTTIDPPRPAPPQKKMGLASPPVPPVPACRGSPSTLPAPQGRLLRALAPAGPPSPTALPPRKPPNLMSPCSPLFQT